jgi:hypothetical protein
MRRGAARAAPLSFRLPPKPTLNSVMIAAAVEAVTILLLMSLLLMIG